MAVPDKPLDLTLPVDLEDWRLDDLSLFMPGGFSVPGFKEFMKSYSNWTPKEVGALTLRDMKSVVTQITAKFEALAVPKANGANS